MNPPSDAPAFRLGSCHGGTILGVEGVWFKGEGQPHPGLIGPTRRSAELTTKPTLSSRSPPSAGSLDARKLPAKGERAGSHRARFPPC